MAVTNNIKKKTKSGMDKTQQHMTHRAQVFECKFKYVEWGRQDYQEAVMKVSCTVQSTPTIFDPGCIGNTWEPGLKINGANYSTEY